MSFSEILLTLFVALIVLGPKRLPEVAYWLGRGLRWFTEMRNKWQTELDSQIKQIELKHNEARAAAAEQQEAKPKDD